MKYIQDKGGDLYRRGIYTFIKRTVPPPTMLMFDASNRDQCEVRRTETNTPLQALVMLNDPHVLEASRVLAEQLIQEKISSEEKIQKAFRKIVCRKVKDEELKILHDFMENEKQAFANSPEEADKLLNIGESPQVEMEDKAALAALMQVTHTIYNMEESITK